MNDDIYNAFADAYVKETLGHNPRGKYSPVDTTKGLFGGLSKENDLEAIPKLKKKKLFSKAKIISTYDNIKNKLISSEQKQAQKQLKNQQKIINENNAAFSFFQLNSGKDNGEGSGRNMTKAFVSFAVAGFFLLMALFNLPSLVLAPQMFSLMFTIAMISAIVGIAFMNGPSEYAKKLTLRINIIASVVMMASIILSLYYSVIDRSYWMSLFFCFVQVNSYILIFLIQFNAVILFFFNTFPAGRAGFDAAKGMANTMLAQRFR
ncbi:sft2-like domain-containing protein [Stylonychia lemnae]|uniref:Vesicle transport protein n=1 Tax=Stylonychia lemnae TaxID=5949 RepID=A0A078A8J4_STYLE|nr:sft2-like domain-containing protein [Stylonychia lemnae]|eukprot:CDW78590.1 sft2-like domain-containing protein [Stylonychia lemnae]